MTRILITSAAIAAILAAAGPARAETKKLTFREAIAVSLKESPEVAVADEAIVGADLRVKSVKSQRLPRVHVEGNLLWWNEEISVVFGAPMPPAPAPELVIRDQLTWNFTAQAVQPLSPLIVIDTLIDLEQAGADFARADLARARLDTAARTAEAYLRVLQARTGKEIAAKSVAQVEANLDRVKKFRDAGAAGDLDVLRLEAARDQARQAVLRATTGEETAGRALSLSIGYPDGTTIQVTDDFPEAPPPPAYDAEEVVRMALARRPEIRGARDRVRQAKEASTAAWASLLPNIAAIAQYQHSEGQGTFTNPDTFFVGVTLSWDVWDWGKNYYQAKEAKSRHRQALLGQAALADQVAFDARRRALDVQTAYETLAVAKSGLVAAEEAYRLQTVRNDEGIATTTEVLDAEVEVLRSRTSFAVARYDYFISLVALARAIGDAPAEAVKP